MDQPDRVYYRFHSVSESPPWGEGWDGVGSLPLDPGSLQSTNRRVSLKYRFDPTLRIED